MNVECAAVGAKVSIDLWLGGKGLDALRDDKDPNLSALAINALVKYAGT